MEECSIGKRIAQLRKQKNWTQKDLAEKLCMTDKAVSKWEQENGVPSQELFPKLSELFNVSIDFIMTGKDVTQIQKHIPLKSDAKAFEDVMEDCLDNNGVIIIDKLLEISDFRIVQKAIANYPIHIIEVLGEKMKKEDWRYMFKFAVDFNLNKLADDIIKLVDIKCRDRGRGRGTERIIKDLKSDVEHYFGFFSNYSENESVRYLRDMNKEYLISIVQNQNYSGIINDIDKVEELKELLIKNLTLKNEKINVAKGLTKSFFMDELSKNNIDLVIIKLCVKLEAILKCDYHFVGDFKTMLDEYCSKLNVDEDDWGYYDSYTPDMLNKLRICRNGIVHAEDSSITLTKDELNWLINYICEMDKN